MPLAPEHRAKLIDSTRDSAVAFAEDMKHLREVLSKPIPTRGEIRRMSGVLRRLLIEDDLRQISAPRLGRISILEYNNKPYYKASAKNPYIYFANGGIEFAQITLRALEFFYGDSPNQETMAHDMSTVEVKIDNFLSQKILCLHGNWASRRSVIKYVAHIAHGVHSGSAREDDEILLDNIRKSCLYSFHDGKPRVEFRITGTLMPAFAYSQAGLDPTLVELHATAYLLTISPSVKELERIIEIELQTI